MNSTIKNGSDSWTGSNLVGPIQTGRTPVTVPSFSAIQTMEVATSRQCGLLSPSTTIPTWPLTTKLTGTPLGTIPTVTYWGLLMAPVGNACFLSAPKGRSQTWFAIFDFVFLDMTWGPAMSTTGPKPTAFCLPSRGRTRMEWWNKA